MSKLDLNSIIPDTQARSDFLSSARKEMYDALKLFHDHVKHSLSLMFAVVTVVFAIFGLVPKVHATVDWYLKCMRHCRLTLP
jgi:hypothetical protein